MFRLFRLISYPQLRASWGRTLLVISGVATGVSLIVAINVINTSVLENFRRTLNMAAGPADLQVTLGIGEVGFDEAIVDQVRADPAVAVAVPLVRGTISLADEPAETLQLFGADLTAEEALQRYQIAAASSRREALRALEDPRAVFLTTRFATRQGLAVGSTFPISTPRGVVDVTVRGLLETTGLASSLGGSLVVMDLPAAQHLLDKQGRVDQIDIVLRSGFDKGEALEGLRQRLPTVLSVARPEHRTMQYESVLASVQAMLTGISTLCLVAGIYIVYNTTSTGAVRRASVMAWLRVVGADAQRLFRLLMMEALVLGVIGTAVGIVYGIALAYLLAGMVGDALAVIFQLRFPVQSLQINLGEQLAIGFVGIASALFASYFAARRIARIEPLDVMRRGVILTSSQANDRRLMLWWVALVGISAIAIAGEVRFKSIALGNFGSVLWNTSVIVVAVPLIGKLAQALRRLLPRLFGAEGDFAASSIIRAPTRTGVTVAAIALVMGAAITLSSLSLSFRRTMNDNLGHLLFGDLIVSSIATEGGWLETPMPQDVANEIAGVAGVHQIETLRILPGQLYRGLRIGVMALSDGLVGGERFPAGWYVEGDPTEAASALRAGTGVTISTSLSDRLDLHLGDSVDLATPTGPLVLPIVGVVPDYVSDRGTVMLSRTLFIERWREPGISRIIVMLDPGTSLESVRSAIVALLGQRHRLKILSLREGFTYTSGMIDRAFAFTDAIQLLITIVTAAGIFDLLLSAITERRRELALWRVIGADERAVRKSIVIESATIGVIGAALGIVLGIVTAWMWIGINYRYLLGYYLEYHLAVGSTLWFAVLVFVMTMLAGYAAAFHATRQSVLDSIQPD